MSYKMMSDILQAKKVAKYAIYDPLKPIGSRYWNCTDGWVAAEDADEFSYEDRKRLRTPDEGYWVRSERLRK